MPTITISLKNLKYPVLPQCVHYNVLGCLAAVGNCEHGVYQKILLANIGRDVRTFGKKINERNMETQAKKKVKQLLSLEEKTGLD